MKRLNKNGIPVLDPPRNALKEKSAACSLPSDHKWRCTSTREEGDGYYFSRVRMYECVKCGEKDVVECEL